MPCVALSNDPSCEAGPNNVANEADKLVPSSFKLLNVSLFRKLSVINFDRSATACWNPANALVTASRCFCSSIILSTLIPAALENPPSVSNNAPRGVPCNNLISAGLNWLLILSLISGARALNCLINSFGSMFSAFFIRSVNALPPFTCCSAIPRSVSPPVPLEI